MKPHFRYNWTTKKWEELFRFSLTRDYEEIDFDRLLTHPVSGLPLKLHHQQTSWNPRIDEWK